MNIFFLIPLMVLASACGAQQQRGTSPMHPAAVTAKAAAPADSAYLVRSLSTRFARPDSALAVEATPPDLARAIDTEYAWHLAESGDDSAALRESLDGRWLLQSMLLNDTLRVCVLHTEDISGEAWMLWLRSERGRLSEQALKFSGRLATQPDDPSFGMQMPGVPPLRVQDVDGDGRPELLLSARWHNGNAYDAIATFYLAYDATLRLHEILRVERWAGIPFDTSGRLIGRSIVYSRGQFLMTTTLVDGPRSILIGTAEFSRSGKFLKRRLVPGTAYKQFLITCHPEGEHAFYANPEKL